MKRNIAKEIHLKRDLEGMGWYMACGRIYLDERHGTTDPNMVTCKQCLRVLKKASK